MPSKKKTTKAMQRRPSFVKRPNIDAFSLFRSLQAHCHAIAMLKIEKKIYIYIYIYIYLAKKKNKFV
jgi:hypothetical protein